MRQRVRVLRRLAGSFVVFNGAVQTLGSELDSGRNGVKIETGFLLVQGGRPLFVEVPDYVPLLEALFQQPLVDIDTLQMKVEVALGNADTGGR